MNEFNTSLARKGFQNRSITYVRKQKKAESNKKLLSKVILDLNQFLQIVPPLKENTIYEKISDGSLLCEVWNKLFPDFPVKYSQGSELTKMKKIQNINTFLNACASKKIKPSYLFELSDLLDKKNFDKVIICIDALFSLKWKERPSSTLSSSLSSSQSLTSSEEIKSEEQAYVHQTSSQINTFQSVMKENWEQDLQEENTSQEYEEVVEEEDSYQEESQENYEIESSGESHEYFHEETHEKVHETPSEEIHEEIKMDQFKETPKEVHETQNEEIYEETCGGKKEKTYEELLEGIFKEINQEIYEGTYEELPERTFEEIHQKEEINEGTYEELPERTFEEIHQNEELYEGTYEELPERTFEEIHQNEEINEGTYEKLPERTFEYSSDEELIIQSQQKEAVELDFLLDQLLDELTSEEIKVPIDLTIQLPDIIEEQGSIVSNWNQAQDEEGNIYYYNSLTGESSWTPPNEDSSFQIDLSPLPTGWNKAYDEEGNLYYYNEITSETSWDVPTTEETPPTTPTQTTEEVQTKPLKFLDGPRSKELSNPQPLQANPNSPKVRKVSLENKERDLRNQLHNYITDLFQSERYFFQKLENIKKHYIDGMKEIGLQDSIINQIFGNFNEILDLHRKLLWFFENEIIPLTQTSIFPFPPIFQALNKIFREISPQFSCYSIFMGNSLNSSNSIALLENEPKYSQFLKNKRDQSKMELKESLSLPIQRIFKYPFFFKKLIHLFPHEKEFKETLTQIEANIISITKIQHEQMNEARYRQLDTIIEGSPNKVFVPGRKLIKEGILRRTAVSQIFGNLDIQEFHCFLFSDSIMFTKTQTRKKEFLFKGTIPLNAISTASAAPKTNGVNAFQLVQKDMKKILFFAKDENDKNSWVENISKCIQEASFNKSISLSAVSQSVCQIFSELQDFTNKFDQHSYHLRELEKEVKGSLNQAAAFQQKRQEMQTNLNKQVDSDLKMLNNNLDILLKLIHIPN